MNEDYKIIQFSEISKDIIEYIKSNTFYFSACLCVHDMKILSGLLLTSTNEITPFYKFCFEIKKLYPEYKENILSLEYNLAISSTLMAIKWMEFTKDSDRYNLQFRTACDDLVPDSFKQLHNITLPFNDPFWTNFFPPNDYCDRSTVVRVRKNKYPISDSKKASELAKEAISPLFWFNSGIDKYPIERFL
jgi:hypothetical protein